MNKELRKAVIAGNWKMNRNPKETRALLAEVTPLIKDAACEVVAYVSFVDLLAVVEAVKGINIKAGAQNCHWEESGVSTGEIAMNMLTFIGVSYVIIGHSERRTYFGETDQTVNQRIRTAFGAGPSVILCVGETPERREQGTTEELVVLQIEIALLGVTKEELTRVIIVYEPIWVIGTGRTATSAQAGEVCRTIRSVTAALYDKQTAGAFTIQYGGSTNAKNAVEPLTQGDVDGGLIGGASLKVADSAEIVHAASEGRPQLYRKGELL